jgi:Protein of unknown function (DUF998)
MPLRRRDGREEKKMATEQARQDEAVVLRVRALLVCGLIAGPLFMTTVVVEGALRPGYDPLRHSISSLAVGPSGWVQTVNFLAAGALSLAFARGLRDTVRTRWGPMLVGLWAVGLLGAGRFLTDPDSGYPPGSPVPVEEPTVHGILHNLSAGVGFPALVAACFVFARRFAAQGRRGWSLYSAASAVVILVFVVLASYDFGRTGGLSDVAGLFQRTSVGAGWVWLTVLALASLREVGAHPRD